MSAILASKLQRSIGPTAALSYAAAEAREVPGLSGTSRRLVPYSTNSEADATAEAHFRDELSVEIVIHADDVRITGNWSFKRGITATAFVGGVLILLATARCTAQAYSGASSAMRAAFRITVSAHEASYRLTGLVGCGIDATGFASR